MDFRCLWLFQKWVLWPEKQFGYKNLFYTVLIAFSMTIQNFGIPEINTKEQGLCIRLGSQQSEIILHQKIFKSILFFGNAK